MIRFYGGMYKFTPLSEFEAPCCGAIIIGTEIRTGDTHISEGEVGHCGTCDAPLILVADGLRVATAEEERLGSRE